MTGFFGRVGWRVGVKDAHDPFFFGRVGWLDGISSEPGEWVC